MASTVRYYSKSFLKESTVQTWKKVYLSEMRKRKRTNGNLDIEELPERKKGRPLMLGEDLDKQVQAYLTALRQKGAVVNTAIAIACAEGIVKNINRNLLLGSGGHINFTKHWAVYLLGRMGLVKRRVTTKAKVSVENFELLKAQFLLDVKVAIEFDDIPPELVINWDQTGIQYHPGQWRRRGQSGSKLLVLMTSGKLLQFLVAAWQEISFLYS